MPSPFPGMNPYLEQSDVWEDFHGRFIVDLASCLDPLVGSNYVVQIETRLYVHELSAEERRYAGRGDVGLTISPGPSQSSTPAVAIASAPVEVLFPSVDVERYSFLEIQDRRNRRVVTVIELLSPTNKKPGPDRDDYVGKRRLLMALSCHFVEIDLRRGGQRPGPPEPPPCDYYVLVSRAQDRPRHGFWPIGLRDRLPVVPIPLKAPDPDVMLDLKAVLDRVYDAAGYSKYIYGETPEPPLSEEDAAWARQFVPGEEMRIV